MRTTRQTAIDAMRSLVAALLIASGIAVLLALEPVPTVLAHVGIPDLAADIVAGLMIANGALMVVPRYAFVATLVPLAAAFFWTVVALRAGELAIMIGAATVAVALVRLARAAKPPGLALDRSGEVTA